MKRIKKYVYLSTGIRENIFESQVEPVLKFMKNNSDQMLHISMESKNAKRKELEIRECALNKDYKTELIFQTKNLTDSDANIDAIKMENIIRHHFSGNGKIVIHARGHVNSYKAAFLKSNNPDRYVVHSDLRGVLWDEIKYGSIARRIAALYRKRLYLRWEYIIVKNLDSISCVSQTFRGYLKAKYTRSDIDVIPTFTDDKIFNYSMVKRNKYRSKLNLGNNPVLIYCGGTSHWQKIEETIDLYMEIKKKISGLIMLFVTHAPEYIKKKVNNIIPDSRLRVLEAKFHEVPYYLCASDLAVLLRDDVPTNNYSAPTKFGEYLCCGLPVLLSPRIGDTEKHIKETGFGYIVKKPLKSIDCGKIEKLFDLDRKRISDYGQKTFSNSSYLNKLLGIYSKILK